MRLSSLWGMMSRHQIWYNKLSASQSSSTASGNADILHRLMKIYCDGRCSTTALKKAIGCDGQRMLVRWLLHAGVLANATACIELYTMVANQGKYGKEKEACLLGKVSRLL